MKRLISLPIVSMLLFVATGCGGDTHESLAAETMPVMRDMVATLGTVKDEASAKSAKPKLEAIAKKMKSINERRTKLPAATEADMKAMLDKYGTEMEELQQKMIPAMMAIQFDPKIQAVLADIDMKMK
jgi:hypothetical protein